MQIRSQDSLWSLFDEHYSHSHSVVSQPTSAQGVDLFIRLTLTQHILNGITAGSVYLLGVNLLSGN